MFSAEPSWLGRFGVRGSLVAAHDEPAVRDGSAKVVVAGASAPRTNAGELEESCRAPSWRSCLRGELSDAATMRRRSQLGPALRVRPRSQELTVRSSRRSVSRGSFVVDSAPNPKVCLPQIARCST